MKVRILATPKSTPKPQQVNAFTNPYAEQTPEMEYGGNLYAGEKPLGSNATIDTKWSYMKKDDKNFMQRNPFSSVGHILPEAEDGTGTVIVEKKEKIMGDFTGDGMPTLMGVNTGSHASGNDQAVTLPSNSFVFSDTPSLKIRDKNVLAQFGKSKAMTPAQLAAQYDLQKYKALIDNDQTPELEKNTAKLNYANAVKKLNSLAGYQEALKGSKGIPTSTLPGQPQDQGQGDGTMMSKFGGRTLKNGGIPQAGGGINTGDIDWSKYSGQMSTPDSADNPNAPEHNFNIPDPKQLYNPDGYDAFKRPFMVNNANTLPSDTVKDGQSAFSPIQQMPWSATVQDANKQAVQQNGDTDPQEVSYNDGKVEPPQDSWMKKKLKQLAANSGSDPNAMGKFYNNLNALTYPHANIREQNAVPYWVHGDTIDNRADIQRLQGLAASGVGSEGVNGPIARAIRQAYQGSLADPINQATARDYELTSKNKQWEQGENKGTFMDTQRQNIENRKDYDALQNNAQKDYWSMLAGRNKNEVNLDNATKTQQRNFAWMNMSNPYYTLDAKGMPMSQTKAQQQAFDRMMAERRGEGSSGFAQEAASVYAQMKAANPTLSEDHIMKLTQDELHGRRVSRTSGPNGIPKSTRESYYAEPQDKYGGKTMEFGGKQLMKPKKQRMRVMECPA